MGEIVYYTLIALLTTDIIIQGVNVYFTWKQINEVKETDELQQEFAKLARIQREILAHYRKNIVCENCESKNFITRV